MYDVGQVTHNVRYYEHIVDDQIQEKKRFIRRKVTQKSEGA